MPTGVSTVDAAIGGIPYGGITEIIRYRWYSISRKSLQAQLLAHARARAILCLDRCE